MYNPTVSLGQGWYDTTAFIFLGQGLLIRYTTNRFTCKGGQPVGFPVVYKFDRFSSKVPEKT